MNGLVFGARASRIEPLGIPRLSMSGIALAATLAFSTAAVAQTWTGAGTGWNTASNWFPVGIPNSTLADVAFTGNGIFYAVNISSSVSARSLSFSNPTLSYSLTSSAGISLSNVQSINVAAGVTAVQSINLANVATGSLRFPTGSNLTITNNSTAAGTTLVIGPNTVLATPGFGGVIVDGAGKTEISGLMSAPSPNRIVGGLTKNGPGTLVLSNAANTYGGGTTINAGTLLLGAGTAIPTGTNVTVNSGEFNIGSLSNNAATAIGTLAVNGSGTFRVPSGNGDYVLTELGMTSGTVDFTGTNNFWLHLKGVPAPGDLTRSYGIDVNTYASSTTVTWIGAPNSRIQNDSGRELYLSVWGDGATPSGIHLDSSVALSSGAGSGAVGSNPNFLKWGVGVMRLTSLANTANINIGQGALRVDDVSTNGVGALGTGAITVAGGELIYGGPSATMTKNLTLANVNIYFCCGGQIQVLTPGVNLNYTGTISESLSNMGLFVYGPGTNSEPSTLTLNNNNTYTGTTQVYNNAILAIPTISNIGQPSPLGLASSGAGVFLGFPNSNPGPYDSRGTLQLTGTSAAYSSNRVVTVYGQYALGGGGAIDVQNAATNLTLSGQITGSGSLIKTGPGTILLTNTSNNFSGGTYVEAGRLHVSGNTALGTSAVTIFPTAVLRYTAGTSVNRGHFLDNGTVEAPGGITLAQAGGTIQGEGTVIGNLDNTGFVEPMGENGLITVEGNYIQGSVGSLSIFADLWLPPGTNPRLAVTGNVALGGTLQMNLGGMGQFRGKRSFDVLDWDGTLNGEFSTLQLPMFGGQFSWDTSQLYTNGVLTLTGPPLEGDYNEDGTVDAADYTVWRNGLDSGLFTAAHYDQWKQNYGASSPGSGGLVADPLQHVPEPAGLALAGFVLAFAWSRRWRNR